METGTLKELNVQPGDVVGCVDVGIWGKRFTKGRRYKVGDSCGAIDNAGDQWLPGTVKFRVISRAQPAVDLTAIATPFGLLDEVYGAGTRDALRAHGGPYELWLGDGWESIAPTWGGVPTYRVKPAPKVETVTEDRWIDMGKFTIPVRVTYTRTDGAIDVSTWKVEVI